MSVSSSLQFLKLKLDLIEVSFIGQVGSIKMGKGVLLSFLSQWSISSQPHQFANCGFWHLQGWWLPGETGMQEMEWTVKAQILSPVGFLLSWGSRLALSLLSTCVAASHPCRWHLPLAVPWVRVMISFWLIMVCPEPGEPSNGGQALTSSGAVGE